MRRGAWVLLAILLLPAVQAQDGGQSEACRPPRVAHQRVPGPFEPGETVTLLFTIENTNGPPVDAVRATVTTTAPAGWSAIPSQRELTLGPGEAPADALAITAPSREAGEPSGNITLVVTFVCTIGEIQTSASAPPVQIPVELAPYEPPYLLFGGILLVLVGGAVYLAVRRLRMGLVLVPTSAERVLAPGRSAKFTFVAENRRGRPGRYHLLPVGLPEGWTVHLALEEIELEPGEEKSLWAIVKAPPAAPPGTVVPFSLRLQGTRAGRDQASAAFRARVVAPE